MVTGWVAYDVYNYCTVDFVDRTGGWVSYARWLGGWQDHHEQPPSWHVAANGTRWEAWSARVEILSARRDAQVRADGVVRLAH